MVPELLKSNIQANLFPLPNLILNPGGKLTLNIFEPRYLELLEACERNGTPLAIAHAETHEHKDFIKIPHNEFPFVFSEVGFGSVQTLSTTENGAKIIVVTGLGKGKITGVQENEGGYLSVSLEDIPYERDLDVEMTFLYRRLKDITRERINDFLKNEREVSVLMDNLREPQELVAFYTDHILKDFKLKMVIFESNNINEKLKIISEDLVRNAH